VVVVGGGRYSVCFATENWGEIIRRIGVGGAYTADFFYDSTPFCEFLGFS
jgi:hypothetical protein